MKLTNKNQITKKLLQENDEVVIYNLCGTTSCLKMRMIDGAATYIKDYYSGSRFNSTTYNTLADLKKALTPNSIGLGV